MDTGDKACNKAQSAAFKYAHLHPFQIPTHGETDDTEAYHPEPMAVTPKVANPKQSPQQGGQAQVNNGQSTAMQAGPSVAKTTPTAGMRQEAVQQTSMQQPALVPETTMFPEQTGHMTLAEAAGAAKTIPILYEIAKDAQKENATQDTWGIIKGRLVTLLEHAPNIETLKNAKDFIRDLGAPNELTLAANKRFQALSAK
jgi:hypothetical protein